ncbi:DUF2523 family protein [Stutzerimonas kunmingensis]|uniref:DUF2523 family protein n=1 Tax=Stutzerimonas kunmingensis TaxID=1211807 RepID=UPI0035242C7A
MEAIGRFFTAILAKFVNGAQWLLSVFKQIFIDLWNIATDAICWLFEGLMSIAVGALNAIETPFDPQTYYSLIPPETVQMMGAIGVTQAITIVVGALVIRFTLQTIPFVRWGS